MEPLALTTTSLSINYFFISNTEQMTFLGLPEACIRRIATRISVPNAASCSLDAATTAIQRAFQPGGFFGDVTHVDSKQTADSVLIFCHGLGGSGDRWVSFVSDKIAPHMPSTRFVLPTAPTRPLSRDPPDPMTAWYDFSVVGNERTPNVDDLLVSATYIRFLAQRESALLKQEKAKAKVFFGGFSQGATLSIYAQLTNPFDFDGIVALSGYSPQFRPFDRDVFVNEEMDKTKNHTAPIFIAHGDADDIIPLSLHSRSVEYLVSAGVPKEKIEARVYPGLRHSTGTAECADIVQFLQRCMKE